MTQTGEIRVGIGGWTFEPWRGVFYPDRLPQKEELVYASRKVTAIEINGTFYGSQKPESFAKWHDETPLQTMMAPQIGGKKLVFAPILRAGLGFVDGMLELVPSARVAHIGLYRDPATLTAVEYYFKAPEDVADRLVIVMDPMLATANSAIAAVERLKERGVTNLRFVCLLAAPEGVAKFHAHHPEVGIWTASIDSQLNDHGYIVPGLGDAGDRMFGTK